MSERTRWITRLAGAPDDADARRVFGDWLREQGDDDTADWLELESAAHEDTLDDAGHLRMRQLQQWVRPAERAALTRAPLEGCTHDGVCPGRWERLDPVPGAQMRRCGPCGSEVAWVDTLAAAEARAEEGRPFVVAAGVRPPPPRRRAPVARPPPPEGLYRSPPPGTMAPPDWLVERRERARAIPPPETPVRVEPDAPARRPWWRRLFGG